MFVKHFVQPPVQLNYPALGELILMDVKCLTFACNQPWVKMEMHAQPHAQFIVQMVNYPVMEDLILMDVHCLTLVLHQQKSMENCVQVFVQQLAQLVTKHVLEELA